MMTLRMTLSQGSLENLHTLKRLEVQGRVLPLRRPQKSLTFVSTTPTIG
jgi:hypothetical protein